MLARNSWINTCVSMILDKGSFPFWSKRVRMLFMCLLTHWKSSVMQLDPNKFYQFLGQCTGNFLSLWLSKKGLQRDNKISFTISLFLIFYCFYCFWVTCCPYDINKIMAKHSECAVSQEEETSVQINLSLCTIKINLLHSTWLWNGCKHPCAWLVSLLLYKNLFWFSTSELWALTPPQEKTVS